LARSAERIPAALEPLGINGVETAIGDVTDSAAVERALDGCDAVLHAASVFSLDARRADEMNSVNVRGTEIVLRTAHRLGLDPINITNLRAPPGRREILTPDSPVTIAMALLRSGPIQSWWRKFQALGAPVVSVIGGIWGPQDPHIVATLAITSCVGGIRCDAGRHAHRRRPRRPRRLRRDEAGRGPRSYLVGGHFDVPDVFTLGDLVVVPPVRDAAGVVRTRSAGWRDRTASAEDATPWSAGGIWIVNCDALR
jgi:hypothetical protein